jgi:hypothetical protein
MRAECRAVDRVDPPPLPFRPLLMLLLLVVDDVGHDETLSVFQLTTDDQKIIRLFELSPT